MNKKPNYRRSIPQERAITKELRKQLAISKKIIETHKEFHDFPIKYEYVKSCPNCNGKGCNLCNQTGRRKKDVTDIIQFPICQKPEFKDRFNKIDIDCRSGNYTKPSIKQFIKALFKFK